MRSLDESSKRWAALFAAIADISDLKNAVKRSNGDGPCITGLRSVCWKSFLLFANFDTPTWSKTLEDSRGAYGSLREHFLRNLEHPEELDSSVDPLADDVTSPWNTLRQDEALRAEIFQDVERCMPENLYFRQPSTQKMLLDVLFVFCKLNVDVSYRQGMHELLAPILWVVERDAIAPESVGDSQHAAETEELLKETLDARFIEHDSFTLFSLVMQTAKSFYELDNQSQPQPVASSASSVTGTSSPKKSSPIVERSKHIHENCLAKVDPGLANRLRELDVLPQVFLIRWIRLLFGREFPFDELLTLWDSLFAEDPALELVDLICVSMLLRVRWQLMEADYSTALTLLLRYPSPGQPNGPSTFVDDALFLRGNLTIAGGIEIISKYSGKTPATLQPESRPSTPQRKPGHAKKPAISSQSQQEKRSTQPRTPLGSPARFIQQQGGLEALLQDAARGFYDRGEKWGVNKAVRDAMDEVKRNVQGLQQSATAAPSRRGAQALPRWSLDGGRSAQAVEEAKTLAAEVQRLSERNKTLADILSDAMDSLWAQQKAMAKESSPEIEGAVEAFNLAIARVQLVKVFLEDSDLPLTEMPQPEPTSAAPQPKTDKPPAMATTAVVVTPALQSQSAHTSTPSPLRSPSRSSSPPASATATPQDPPPPPPGTPSSITTPAEQPRSRSTPATSLHHPRSSLAQSSFAWMLGGDDNSGGGGPSSRRDAAASFAEFSSPGSPGHRTSSNVAKKGFLFGGDPGEDAVATSCT
ncbi:hypothetical protein FGG08_007235 [Glutinoglossum americanum]|uniref:Rab-GAP TBC domain-containing protein n=1 Tax=Glutinoglossum americanum TaxID=1670608 RepID=A0A9P8HR72_9PEZI|nr:hypothetical protein FGG08_007235 [Glutinoglossum americanum]